MVTEPYGYLLKPLNVDELKANIGMALYKHKTETARKDLLKNRIMDDYYRFMIETMSQSTDKNEDEIKDMLLLTFEKSFEDKMKKDFEEEIGNMGINLKNEDATVLFEAYLSWISKLFRELGIKNQIRYEDDSWYLEFSNCPWMKHSTKNPIFCINCTGMVNSSFKWTNLEGNIDVISQIANKSPKCSFRFY
jgi:predicted ArsR family transcriptional regulator